MCLYRLILTIFYQAGCVSASTNIDYILPGWVCGSIDYSVRTTSDSSDSSDDLSDAENSPTTDKRKSQLKNLDNVEKT